MSKKKIDAIFWRSYLAATSSALWNLNKSQYYFEMPAASPDYEEFLGPAAVKSKDDQGNDTFSVELAPFEGVPPVEPYLLRLTRLRPGVARAGKWQVLNQHGSQAYPLWQKGRGPLTPFQNMNSYEAERNFIVILRDDEGNFHGRWIRCDDFKLLPMKLQELLFSKDAGWSKL